MTKTNGFLSVAISCGFALAGGIALSPAAWAQVDADAAIEEIIVTATKRESTLAEIPMSITVLDGNVLERQKAVNFEDLVALVPGLSITGNAPGATRLTLRGINTGGVASTVGTYFDDVPFGSSTGLANGAVVASDFDTFDMARIEVLRGPQGTLYGANSLAGVLKYVPNPVDLDSFEANITGAYESVEGGGPGNAFTGAINVPVSDWFGFRAAAFSRSDDGYIDSLGNNPIPSATDPTLFVANTRIAEDINSYDTFGGRITALVQATDNFSIELMAMQQNIDSEESGTIDADPDTLQPLYGTLAQSSYHAEWAEVDYTVYSADIDIDFGGLRLQSITSAADFETNFLADVDPLLASTLTFFFGDPATRPLGSIQLQETSTDKVSQEFRLLSANNDTFEWLVGAYYTEEDSAIIQDIQTVEGGTESEAAGLPAVAFATILSEYEELAFFADATWFITPNFEVSFGARTSSNDQSSSQEIVSAILGDSPLTAASSSESPFTWSLAPRFRLTDDTSIYARIATGFRPGGPNVLPPNPPPGTPATFDSDTLTSYEIGVKTGSDGALVSFEAALFFLKWEDVQLLTRINDVGLNANGGSAESKGVEFAARFAPTDELTMSFTGAYTDTELTEDTDPVLIGGNKGDPLPYVPEWSFGLSGDYEWLVNGDATAYVGGSYSYTGDRTVAFNNRDADGNIREAAAFGLLNLRGGMEWERWSLEVYGQNLTDEKGSNFTGGASSLPNGATSLGLVRPRTYGVQIGFNF